MSEAEDEAIIQELRKMSETEEDAVIQEPKETSETDENAINQESKETSETQDDALLQYVRGFPFSKAFFYKKKNLEGILDYVAHDGDIVIVSYPKTGMTWLEYIILHIIRDEESFPDFNDDLLKCAPFMEYVGPDVIHKMESPRLYRTNLPYDRLNINPKAKYLYIYRNPEDHIMSYYRFLKEIRPVSFDFKGFLDGYLTGRIEYARYFEHILSYLEHEKEDHLLMICYEKLLVDRRRLILEIAKFLGEEHFQRLYYDASILQKVVERTGFKYIQKAFARKGVFWDGRSSLSPEDVKRIRDKARELMSGTEILKAWSIFWD